MLDVGSAGVRWYRVWITRYENWQPKHWHDVPPEARAVELAVAQCLPREAAFDVVEGFNGLMLRDAGRLWAVAVPVALRYDGDVQPGDIVIGAVTSEDIRLLNREPGQDATASATAGKIMTGDVVSPDILPGDAIPRLL